MNGLIFDDATCEFAPPFVAIPPPRVRDYIRIETITVPPEPLGPTMRSIRAAVAEHYGLTELDMVSARKSNVVAHPRQLAMYLCRQLTARTLPEIGRMFGGRDHSTVIHAIRVVEARLATQPDIRTDHAAILEALGE